MPFVNAAQQSQLLKRRTQPFMLDLTLHSLKFHKPGSPHNGNSTRTLHPVLNLPTSTRRLFASRQPGCQYLCKYTLHKCILWIPVKCIYILHVKRALFSYSFSLRRGYQSLNEIQLCVILHKGLSWFLGIGKGFTNHHKQQKKDKVSLSVFITVRFRPTLH